MHRLYVWRALRIEHLGGPADVPGNERWGPEIWHIAPCNSGMLKCWEDTACSAQHGFRSPRATGIPKELTHCFLSPSNVLLSFLQFNSPALVKGTLAGVWKGPAVTSSNTYLFLHLFLALLRLTLAPVTLFPFKVWFKSFWATRTKRQARWSQIYLEPPLPSPLTCSSR